VADVSGIHPDIGSELRRLAQVILDGIDPAVRSAAALAAGAGAGTGKCQQVWCPVCALAAVVSGEQHPLVTVIADHSVALLDVLRSIVDDIDRSAEPPPDDPAGEGLTAETAAHNGNGSSNGKSRYQPIPVTLEE
jgi:hypothetical protein